MAGPINPDQRRFLRHFVVWFPLVGAVVCLLWLQAADSTTDVVIGILLGIAVIAVTARLFVVLRGHQRTADDRQTAEGTR